MARRKTTDIPSLPTMAEQRAAMRKSAPRQAKLTESRGARSRGTTSVRMYGGTGNMPRYVKAILDAEGIRDRATFDYALAKANRYFDRNGFAPSKTDLLGAK